MTECDSNGGSDLREIAASAIEAAGWFAQQVTTAMADNLLSLTIHGPVVTSIFRRDVHRLHYLIVVVRQDIDQLLHLAKFSTDATKKRIAPPLILTADALKRSHDVFPLEWLDIAQYHLTVFGEPALKDLNVEVAKVRLQCERELRSLDLQLQRGILASGGDASRLQLLEAAVSDSLVRILRGISWLAGDRKPLLPDELSRRCELITKYSLSGCSEAIHINGRRDITSLRAVINEIAKLSDWVDQFEKTDS